MSASSSAGAELAQPVPGLGGAEPAGPASQDAERGVGGDLVDAHGGPFAA